MNGPALQIITDGAVFHGELRRDFIALGVVLAIMLLIWAIQAFRGRC